MQMEKISTNISHLHINNCCIYFSYETPVAFVDSKNNAFISKNEWSRTTGKHINLIKKSLEESANNILEANSNELKNIMELEGLN